MNLPARKSAGFGLTKGKYGKNQTFYKITVDFDRLYHYGTTSDQAAVFSLPDIPHSDRFGLYDGTDVSFSTVGKLELPK